MKLRNKKTGEVREIKEIVIDKKFIIKSLADLFSGYEVVSGKIDFICDLGNLTPEDFYPYMNIIFGGKNE